MVTLSPVSPADTKVEITNIFELGDGESIIFNAQAVKLVNHDYGTHPSKSLVHLLADTKIFVEYILSISYHNVSSLVSRDQTILANLTEQHFVAVVRSGIFTNTFHAQLAAVGLRNLNLTISSPLIVLDASLIISKSLSPTTTPTSLPTLLPTTLPTSSATVSTASIENKSSGNIFLNTTFFFIYGGVGLLALILIGFLVWRYCLRGATVHYTSDKLLEFDTNDFGIAIEQTRDDREVYEKEEEALANGIVNLSTTNFTDPLPFTRPPILSPNYVPFLPLEESSSEGNTPRNAVMNDDGLTMASDSNDTFEEIWHNANDSVGIVFHELFESMPNRREDLLSYPASPSSSLSSPSSPSSPRPTSTSTDSRPLNRMRRTFSSLLFSPPPLTSAGLELAMIAHQQQRPQHRYQEDEAITEITSSDSLAINIDTVDMEERREHEESFYDQITRYLYFLNFANDGTNDPDENI